MNNSKLTPKVQKNLTLALVVLWTLCTVAWIVAIVLDIIHDAAILQFVLHGFCAVGAVACAVLNFRRWRRMPDGDDSTEEALDTEGK